MTVLPAEHAPRPHVCLQPLLQQAVGGTDGWVHIMSIDEAAVVAQLPVPAGTSVVELSAAAGCPGLLLVLCKDGSMQLWQLSTGTCLWSSKSDAFAAVSICCRKTFCAAQALCSSCDMCSTVFVLNLQSLQASA